MSDFVTIKYFNKENFQKIGSNWIRQAKSENLSGFIVSNIQSEMPNLGFDLISLNDNYTDFDIFYNMIPKLNKKSCLFLKTEDLPIIPESNADCICGSLDVSLDDLVFPVENLFKRADAIKSIQTNIIEKYGTLLSGNYVYGTYDFWKTYTGFQSLLIENKYLDRIHNYHDLMLNLFIANISQNILIR
jgi:hypothetical protein